MLSSAGNVLLLAFGFGFVIFWHELGHFLAAKWADVKVEQFAVGFGQALFSWRKGLGFRFGSSIPEYERMLQAEKEGVASPDLSKISETEYRLNWIPLGGYVKMLGQDDMKPGEQVADPRSYTSKPVGKRMVIVSAGVIMNVILAAIGFIWLFSIGYEVPKPTVGLVVPGSPAQLATRADNGKPDPIRAGDTIVSIDGRWQADFDKIRLNTPLLIPGEPVPVEVRRAGGDHVDKLIVTPRRATPDSEFPQLGIAPAQALAGLDPEFAKQLPRDEGQLTEERYTFKPGDVVTAVAGDPVTPDPTDRPDTDQADKLGAALRNAAGQPVPVTIKGVDGKERTVNVPPHFVERFGESSIDMDGLQMLLQVTGVASTSPLAGTKEKPGVQPGDVIVEVADVSASGGKRAYPTQDELEKFVHQAVEGASSLTVTVLRKGERITLPTAQLGKGQHGLGIEQEPYDAEAIVATPPVGTGAAEAQLPGGTRLVTVDDKPVHSWFDIFNVLTKVEAGQPVALAGTVDGKPRDFTLAPLTEGQVAAIRQNQIGTSLYVTSGLTPARYTRKAKGIGEAAKWGVWETRDAIMQVYLTMRSMFRGGISPKELSGPVGILAVGYKLAQAGSTRLLWFLSIISANLAVMNFLPIPVVDGGLFTFLIIEKLKGRPVNQKTQAFAQYVGLALLLSVFLFATWQDLFRIPMLFHH